MYRYLPGEGLVAELSNAHKEAIVVALARFRSPSEVAALMRADFGLDLGEHAVQQIVKYDPTRPAFEAGDKWRAIFDLAREAYSKDMEKVIVANQAWRLNELHDLYNLAKKAKNTKLAADLLEQIARECGGVMTNSRELTVNDKREKMTAED